MKKVEYAFLVEESLIGVKPQDVRYVYGWIDRLSHWDEDAEVREKSWPLPGRPGFYYLATPTDIRFFFEIAEDTVTIHYIVRQATIDAVAGRRDRTPIQASGTLEPVA